MATLITTEDIMAKPQSLDPLFGLVAEFDDPEKLVAAAEKTYEKGYRKIDAYSPFPIHGLSDAIGFPRDRVAMTSLIGGLLGGFGGFGFMYWSAVFAYPHNIGGRPLNSWPMFIPITFECTVLLAALSAAIGMLIMNGFPTPYHSIFNTPGFERMTSDRFFLAIESSDASFDRESARSFLQGLGALNVSEVLK
jgi:hypothetical protein